MQSSSSITKYTSGFSLIETLVALGLLASVALTVSKFISSAIGEAHQSALHHRAVMAVEEISTLAGLNYAQSGNNGALDTNSWQYGQCNQQETPSPSGRIKTTGWLNEISCALPESQAKLTSSANSLIIKLRWRRDGLSEHHEIAVERAL